MTQKSELVSTVKGKTPGKTHAAALSPTGASQISASIYHRWSPASGFGRALVSGDQSRNWTVQAKYLRASEPRWRINITDKTQLSKTA